MGGGGGGGLQLKKNPPYIHLRLISWIVDIMFFNSLNPETISQHTVTKESKFLIFKSMSNLSKMLVKADR